MWDLTLGRERAKTLAANFEAAFEPIRVDRGWWPNTAKHSAWVILRTRELGAERAVRDQVIPRWLVGALGEWNAARGGEISQTALTRRLRSKTFGEALMKLADVSIVNFTWQSHGAALESAFETLEGIKSSKAQLVAVSKTLHHLLPELVVPFDNVVTAGFFGWRGLPDRSDPQLLLDVYDTLSAIAKRVGTPRLDRLGTPTWPRDPAVAGAIRIGQARVIDFGMAGYLRAFAEAWHTG